MMLNVSDNCDLRSKKSKSVQDDDNGKFLQYHGYVKKTLNTSQGLVDSITGDMQEVRGIIQQRLQRRVDLEQLVALLQSENECLKVSSL